MRARLRLRKSIFVIAVGLGGCGSPQVEAPLTPTALPKLEPTESAAPAEPPPQVAAHPSSEGLVVRLRVTGLTKLRDTLPPQAVKKLSNELSDDLGLDRGILESPNALQSLGIDPAGEITFESFETSERGRAMVARIRGLDVSAKNDELSGAFMDERSRAKDSGWFMTRIRLPTKGDSLGEMAERALMKRDGRRTEIAKGDMAFALERAVWHLKREPNSLLVEIAMSDRPAQARDVRDALAELGAWNPSVSAPLAANDLLGARLSPSVVATAGMLLESQQTRAFADLDREPEIVQRLVAETIRQARALDIMDAPSAKPRYASVAFTITGATATLTSTLSPDTEALEAGDWSTDGADFTVDGSLVSYSVNGPLLYRWKMLPDRDGKNPYFGNDIAGTAEHAGFVAMLLFVGDSPFLFGRLGMEEGQSLGHATLPFLRKWDRLGVAVTKAPKGRSAEPTYIGILPANATEENAACALAREPTKCAPADRIRANAMSKRGVFSVTRKKVQGHWVVMGSADEALLKSLPLHVTVGPRAAASATLDPTRIAAEILRGSMSSAFGALPVYHVTASASGDKRSFTFDLK